MLRRLPYGPNLYWRRQIARVGPRIIVATRLIGRWYWVTQRGLMVSTGSGKEWQ